MSQKVSAERSPGPWVHREAVVNGVRLHYVEAGEGPLVVLLHGFPEFWYSWRHQIPVLAQAGFRVLAPDLRGYNLSDKPSGVASYRLSLLTQDVRELIAHVGATKAVVAGHDWGGAIAWNLAMTHPPCVERLVILNAPHPAIFARELRRLPQLLRSWYIFFFQLPWLPELSCRWHNYALLTNTLRRDPRRPDCFSEMDRACYRNALSQPGALTAALNYYRATFRDFLLGKHSVAQRMEMTTLVLWGTRDRYLGERLLDGLDYWVNPVQIERLHGVSHWVQVEAAEQVNHHLLAFLGNPHTLPSDE